MIALTISRYMMESAAAGADGSSYFARSEQVQGLRGVSSIIKRDKHFYSSE